MIRPLFVYGTLHPDRAPAVIRSVARRLEPLGRATLQGTLYDLGRYPGLILPGSAPRAVSGEIFRLPPDPTVLARLDAYEDFRPGNPAASLFVRVEAEAELPDGSSLRCWTYCYNCSVAGRMPLRAAL